MKYMLMFGWLAFSLLGAEKYDGLSLTNPAAWKFYLNVDYEYYQDVLGSDALTVWKKRFVRERDEKAQDDLMRTNAIGWSAANFVYIFEPKRIQREDCRTLIIEDDYKLTIEARRRPVVVETNGYWLITFE